MAVNRRDVLAGMGALAAIGVTTAGAQDAAAAVADKAAGDFASGSKVFALSATTPTKAANGSNRIGGPDGALATGEKVSMHESWMPPGLSPSAAHRITHSELVMVIEGEMEFEHDGKKDPVHAGDVVYVAYGTNHALRNVGTTTARYMVWQMGGDTK